jgi:hypothetical protein
MHFFDFINQLEKDYRCDFGYVRGDDKRLSGCGKPACRLHYHVLLACAASVDPKKVEKLWMSIAGHRSDDAGAVVEPFDPSQNGVSYVLKLHNREGDWTPGKLELFLPAKPGVPVGRHMRRHLHRHHLRQQRFETTPPSGACPVL